MSQNRIVGHMPPCRSAVSWPWRPPPRACTKRQNKANTNERPRLGVGGARGPPSSACHIGSLLDVPPPQSARGRYWVFASCLRPRKSGPRARPRLPTRPHYSSRRHAACECVRARARRRVVACRVGPSRKFALSESRQPRGRASVWRARTPCVHVSHDIAWNMGVCGGTHGPSQGCSRDREGGQPAQTARRRPSLAPARRRALFIFPSLLLSSCTRAGRCRSALTRPR